MEKLTAATRRSAAAAAAAASSATSSSTAEQWPWTYNGTLIYGKSSDSRASAKIAAFDMDFTLVKPKNGGKFPKSATDWEWWNDAVPQKLQDLHKDGFKVVIFSNQGGIAAKKQKESDITRKIEALSRAASVPLHAFLASADDEWRKPARNMWDLFTSKHNEGVAVDMSASFYCGDAAGRKGPPKDFSDTDLKFATNVGLKFYVPEETFLGQAGASADLQVEGFNPKTLPRADKGANLFKEKGASATANGAQELVLFCGSPGSGKSTFAETYMPDYVRVNRDTLKTKEKCHKVADESLAAGKSVVVDNTLPTREDRAYYLDLGAKYKIPVRCFYFTAPKELCMHLNDQRAVNTVRKHLSSKVPKMVIHSWFKNHVRPEVKEGFKEVLNVQFAAGPFKNDQEEKMFFSFGGK